MVCELKIDSLSLFYFCDDIRSIVAEESKVTACNGPAGLKFNQGTVSVAG